MRLNCLGDSRTVGVGLLRLNRGLFCREVLVASTLCHQASRHLDAFSKARSRSAAYTAPVQLLLQLIIFLSQLIHFSVTGDHWQFYSYLCNYFTKQWALECVFLQVQFCIWGSRGHPNVMSLSLYLVPQQVFLIDGHTVKSFNFSLSS